MTETSTRPRMTLFLAVAIAEGQEAAIDDDQWREAWQFLVDGGYAWILQGWFGRTARALIDAGIINPPGNEEKLA